MKKVLVLIVLVATLAGCAATRTPTPAAIYDFGLHWPSSGTAEGSGVKQLQRSLLVTDASVPVSIDNTGIHYRLAYHDPGRSYVYGSSRWAAPPAVLLTQRLRSRIAGISEKAVVGAAENVVTDYALRIEIEEFSQVFDTPDRSRGVVKLRVGLIDRSTRLLIAQRTFMMEQTAATPDAAGAAHALTEASDQLIGELISWITDELMSEKKEAIWKDGTYPTDD